MENAYELPYWIRPPTPSPPRHITRLHAWNLLKITLRLPSTFIPGSRHDPFQIANRHRGHLNKAKQIAELRSPTRDDGVIARILWKTAVVLESDVLGKFSSEADALRQRAEVARNQLMVSGEGGSIPFVDEDDAERDQEEDSYDALVPLFYR
jgi:hypothetical protein